MIKIIFTSALIENKFEQRKQEYLSAYNSLKNLINKESIFILECYSDNLQFLQNFDCAKFLSLSHKTNIKNKGVLEFEALKKFINSNSNLFKDDDYIVKITGRYKLKSNKFFQLLNKSENLEFVGKLMNNNTQVFAGLFAMKFMHLKNFLNTLNFEILEQNMICIENYILDFVILNKLNCGFVNELEIFAPIFGTGDIMELNL